MRWLLFLLPFLMAFTPSVPMNLSVTCPTATQCNLTWVDPTPLENVAYIVERATDLNFQNGFVQNTTAVNATTFSATGLSTGTAYFWRVKASDYVGPVTATPTTSTTSTTGATTTVTTSSTTSSTTATTSSTTNTTTVTTSTTSTTNINGGSCVFSRKIDGPATSDSSVAWAIASDSSGNFYPAGQATGTLDFGAGGIAGQSSPRAWVAKYTNTNTLVWAKRFGTSTNFASDATYGVASTPAGVVTITGSFGEPVDFGGGTITNAGADIFVASYQTDGTFKWAKKIGTQFTNIGRAVAVDASGNVYATGSFQGTADFGNGINVTSAGGKDVFLVKYDPNGTFLWAKQFGSTGDDEAFGVAVDPVTGNVTMVGSFTGNVLFGGGTLVSAGATDIFIATYDPSGTHLRSNRYGNTGSDIAYAVAADANGNIAVTGQADLGTQNFGGATFTNPAGPDIFLVKYNAAGAHQWSALYGTNSSSDSDVGYGVAFDAGGNVGLTGTILNGVNFGGGSLVGGGTFDIFAAKFTATGTHVWSKRYVADYTDIGRGVAFDATGGFGLAGYFTNTVDLGCGLLSPTNGVFSQSVIIGKLTP